jgi:hypothetical protein
MQGGGWQPPPGGPPPPYGETQPPATAATQLAPAPVPTTQPSFGQQQQAPYPPQAPYPQAQPQPQPQPQYALPYGAPMPAQYAGAGGYGFGNYEFNDTENGIIAKTAGRAKTWGIISIVVGALYLLSVLFFIFSPLLLINIAPGIGGIIMGISFLGVGSSLNSVVQTQGNDVQHMMQATEKLGSACLTQIIVTIVQALMYALLVVLVIFVLMVAIATGGGP